MQRTIQEATDYESVQKSLEASEIHENAVKRIGERIKSINDRTTLRIYGERISMAVLSDKLKKRVATWIARRMEEL